MAITAKQVNELRQLTGAGMMDCKKALVETDGNIEAAVDLLRKKGQKVAAKREGREANEGAVFAHGNGSSAVLLELNCETDFVARNDDFQKMGAEIAETAFASKPSDLQGLLGMDYKGQTVESSLTDAMGKIGEKISTSSYAVAEADRVVTYIHPGARVGVMVAFEGDSSESVDAIGKDIAMQIAAMKPVSLDKGDVPQEVQEKELEIGREQAREQGKPEAIIDKIANGKLNKFFKENTLLNQDFVKDPSKTVSQYLKAANPNLKIKSFSRIQLGGQ